MATVVVPFRGAAAKRRLTRLTDAARVAVASAMLADVVAAAQAVGTVFVVTPERRLLVPARLVADRGAGQGAAVAAGLDAAIAAGAPPPYLVVNADLPCATARDLLTLAGAVPENGLALVPAADGTTNALALASVGLFAPVYGPGSAARFRALAPSRLVDAPNLVDDVDTDDDLQRLRARLGTHTARALDRLDAGAAA